MLQQKDYSEITIALETLYAKSYFILKYLTSYCLKDIMDILFFILHIQCASLIWCADFNDVSII